METAANFDKAITRITTYFVRCLTSRGTALRIIYRGMCPWDLHRGLDVTDL